jgi:hypothetical protein
MAQHHYTAEIATDLLLKLPGDAEALQLKPGDTVEVQIEEPSQPAHADDEDQTVALLESWIAQAPTEPAAIREAEEDLREFKRNMNRPRRESGGRVPYPEIE